MKDKIQEAAEAHGNTKHFSLINDYFACKEDFKAGATYMQEQNKDSIQELVSALEYATIVLKANGYYTEDGKNDLLIQKHKQ